MTQIPSYLDPEIAPFQLSFNTSPRCNNWSVTPEHFIKNNIIAWSFVWLEQRPSPWCEMCSAERTSGDNRHCKQNENSRGATKEWDYKICTYLITRVLLRWVNRNFVNCFRVIQFSQSVWYISHTPQKEKQRQIFEWKFKTCHLSLKGKQILNWRLNFLEVTRTSSWLILF